MIQLCDCHFPQSYVFSYKTSSMALYLVTGSNPPLYLMILKFGCILISLVIKKDSNHFGGA